LQGLCLTFVKLKFPIPEFNRPYGAFKCVWPWNGCLEHFVEEWNFAQKCRWQN
jgi:hypothetical protein